MAHVRLRKLPATALPVGAVSSTDTDGTIIVEHASLQALAEWRLTAMKAGHLDHSDLLGSGEPAAERQPVEVSAAVKAALDTIVALPASATLTQLRNARTALVNALNGG